MPQRTPIEVEYTGEGYVLLSAEVAAQYFPNDALVVMARGDEIWLLPTRGPAAGGLLLKQRNRAGDRALLASPYLPSDAAPGRWPAFWDAASAALRIAFRLSADAPEAALDPAIAVKAVVEKEQGRWVVFLELGYPTAEPPGVRTERRRIADYATEQQAVTAAHWFERTADREVTRPNLGL